MEQLSFYSKFWLNVFKTNLTLTNLFMIPFPLTYQEQPSSP